MKKAFKILFLAVAMLGTLVTTPQAANAIYPEYKDAVLTSAANSSISAGTVKVILVDLADYTYSAAHEFLSDVPAAARVAISPALASKVIAAGNFDSADTTWTAVTGDPSEAVILFIDTGVEGTSRLIAYYDTGLGNFPITPNGGNVDFAVDAGGWFNL